MFANSRLPHDRRLAIGVGLILLVATYLIFSVRAVLDPITPGHVLSLKRLIATTGGAGLFLFAISWAARMPACRWSQRLLAVLWITALGSVAMLAFRIGYDMLVDNRPDAVVARNARWMLTWLGYFAAAIGGYFAITFVRQSLYREPPAPTFDRADLASVVIEEVAEWTPQERRELLARLSGIRDYEESDPLVGSFDEPPHH